MILSDSQHHTYPGRHIGGPVYVAHLRLAVVMDLRSSACVFVHAA